MIKATVIADSVFGNNNRITTMELRYPRFIHSELMTHRMFSRNASSSRAIPVARLIEEVRTNPAIPIHWGKNKAGMQADGEVDDRTAYWAKQDWNDARLNACVCAERMAKAGVHKQVVNRILEPFQYINVLVTSTEWENFFKLRDHPDAQPEIQALAKAMKEALKKSYPTRLDLTNKRHWHLPYVTHQERLVYSTDELKALSVARCASVSYKTVDGKPMTIDKALRIYEKLTNSDPIHASPFEHVAYPDPTNNKVFTRNFDYWGQLRANIEVQRGYKAR